MAFQFFYLYCSLTNYLSHHFVMQRIFDATKEKVSEIGRALELEAAVADVGGIDLEQAKKALQEEDKYDKELFRQRIKAKHREERLKAKAERRAAAGVHKEKGDVDEEAEGDESDYESSDDEEVADIIDALPDPDRVYGEKSDDDEDDEDVYTGPTGPAPR